MITNVLLILHILIFSITVFIHNVPEMLIGYYSISVLSIFFILIINILTGKK